MAQEKQAGVMEYVNAAFNPFEWENLPRNLGDTNKDVMLKRLPFLLAGTGGVGMLLRYLKHQKDTAEMTKSDEKLKAYVQARNPIVSLDPSTRDTKREQKEKSLGVQEVEYDPTIDKEASGELDFFKSMNSTGAKTVQDLASTKKHWLHPSLAIAAALAGGLGGWHLMDRKLDRDRNKDLEEQIAKEENKIDKLLYKEYLKSRGLDKEANTFDMSREPAPTGPVTHTGNIKDILMNPSKGGALGMSLWGIAALGLMALSYKASREFTDSKDPNRTRMKELKQALKEKGRVRTAPIFTDLSNFPSMGRAPRKTSATTGVKMPGKMEDKNPVKAPPADESDPYASLLTQG